MRLGPSLVIAAALHAAALLGAGRVTPLDPATSAATTRLAVELLPVAAPSVTAPPGASTVPVHAAARSAPAISRARSDLQPQPRAKPAAASRSASTGAPGDAPAASSAVAAPAPAPRPPVENRRPETSPAIHAGSAGLGFGTSGIGAGATGGGARNGYGTGAATGNTDSATGNGVGGRGRGVSSDLLAAVIGRIRAHRRYPSLARQRGIEGTVGLSFSVRADGSVDVRVVRSADPILDDAARAAVLDAAPLPPIEGALEIDLDFHLVDR